MGWSDMQGFTDYLVRNRLVPEQNATFHGMWVRKCLAFQRNFPQLSPESGRLEDLASLRQGPGVRDWQYQQAQEATRIYLTNYLPTLTGHGHGTDELLSAVMPEIDVFEAVRTELRLGHYSHRTEKTYLERLDQTVLRLLGPDGTRRDTCRASHNVLGP